MFCDRIQQLLGADRQDPPFVAMLANGTSGNINNIDFSKKAEKRDPYEKMREVADRVARAAHKAYQTIVWKDSAPLAGKLESLEVGVRHPTAGPTRPGEGGPRAEAEDRTSRRRWSGSTPSGRSG